MKQTELSDTRALKRISAAVPAAWLQQVEIWRRRQTIQPTLSQTIRHLVEIGLECESNVKRK